MFRAGVPRLVVSLVRGKPARVRDPPLQDATDPLGDVGIRVAAAAGEPPHLNVGGGENRDPLPGLRKTCREVGGEDLGRAVDEPGERLVAAARDRLHRRRLEESPRWDQRWAESWLVSLGWLLCGRRFAWVLQAGVELPSGSGATCWFAGPVPRILMDYRTAVFA
ncbi:hypothetical protein GCM10010109_32640 [Actinoplanes campanulatus]|nr:hypothetical protein GCM10010109_32640 [Actinoplanes campanulatus]GID41602.1 hypothetical protein Aca09nite_81080 [Actinoplanes campanulatus]